jgi:hypothetical protein
MALETGIFISQAIWLYRFRHLRREAKKCGKSYDEYVAERSPKQLTPSTSVFDLEWGKAVVEGTSKKEDIAAPEKCKVLDGRVG